MSKYGKVYQGIRHEDGVPHVMVDEATLDPGPSQLIVNHSPDGFEWGYGGSGPSQTALAILFNYTGDRRLSLRWHQDFKWCFIANAAKEGFQINASEIEEFFDTRPVRVKEKIDRENPERN